VKRGGQINGRAKATGKVGGRNLFKRRLAIPAVIFLVVGLIIAGTAFQKHSSETATAPQNAPAVKAENPAFKTPHTLAELLALSPADLVHCDIARMNLLCAESLPGAENLNVG